MSQGRIYSPRKTSTLQAWVLERIQQNQPFAIRGANSRNSEKFLDVLSTRNLKDILFFDPDDMVIGVQAGMRARDLQIRIHQKKMFLPFNPWYPDSTIGSVVACNDYGASLMNGGGLRDSIIGIEYVNGKGELVKAGGRVVKNVTGYDLGRMMLGSRGGLGVITAVNFKIHPQPPAASVLYGDFENDRWLPKVKVLQERMIPVDWIEAVHSKPAGWVIGIGFSGNSERQNRIAGDLCAIFSEGCEVVPEGKISKRYSILPGRKRFFGFLPDLLRPLNLGKHYLHLHCVAPTAEMLALPDFQEFITQGACAIAHPIGGDFHLIQPRESLEAQKTMIESLKNQLKHSEAAITLVHSAPGLTTKDLETFAIPNAYALLKSMKRQLDPAAVFHAPFYELD